MVKYSYDRRAGQLLDKRGVISQIEEFANFLDGQARLAEGDPAALNSVDRKFVDNLNGLCRSLDTFVRHWK